MNLKEKINKDFEVALKTSEKTVLGTLRLLKSALKNEEIAQKGEINDKEIIKIIRSEVKKRKDSIIDYKKGQRDDLVEKEQIEIDILQNYLPEELSIEVIEEIVLKFIKEKGKDNFPAIMGAVMKEVDGRADGAIVGKIVKEKIAE